MATTLNCTLTINIKAEVVMRLIYVFYGNAIFSLVRGIFHHQGQPDKGKYQHESSHIDVKHFGKPFGIAPDYFLIQVKDLSNDTVVSPRPAIAAGQ